MFSYLKNLIKHRPSPYHSLNNIFIHSRNLLHNLSYLQSLKPNDTIIPVLKSNAYGHGLKQVCQILNQTNKKQCPLIAIDSYPEYQIIRDYTDKDILVMGETRGENYTLYNPKRTHIAIGSLTTFKALLQTQKPYKVHLFLNTGMNREGFQQNELQTALNLLNSSKSSSVIIGLMSHLANADLSDSSFNDTQIDNFTTMYHHIKEAFALSPLPFQPQFIHIGNTAGLTKINNPLFNTRRTGIGFYGYNHLDPSDPYSQILEALQPALEINSTITSIHQLKKGDSVSYGRNFRASHDCMTCTIPFGYYEGLDKRLSNQRTATTNNTLLQQRGSICMNLSSFLLPTHTQADIGDQITLFSHHKDSTNTIIHASHLANTIPYQILTSLNPGLKRTIC